MKSVLWVSSVFMLGNMVKTGYEELQAVHQYQQEEVTHEED